MYQFPMLLVRIETTNQNLDHVPPMETLQAARFLKQIPLGAIRL